MPDGRCPVCCLADGLTGDARYQEICPCCGVQFGYDDARMSHEALRARWISAGMLWWSSSKPPPVGWDPETQIQNCPES